MVASSPKPRSRRRAASFQPPPPPPPPLYQQALKELMAGPGATVIGIVAIAGALAYMFGWLGKVADSGPLPIPSRQEVIQLRQDTDKKFNDTADTIKQTLGVAQSANISAQNALAEGQSNRLDRLLTQKTNLEALLKMNPNDPTLKQALSKTDIDISTLTNLIRNATQLPQAPQAPTLPVK